MDNVKPIYYKGEGLAITEYIHVDVWDEVRAYVVMEFPYNGKTVKQAFYRSSGHNSAESFGKEFTDRYGDDATKLARGTWLPFNAIVVKIDSQKIEEHGEDLTSTFFTLSKKNISYIMKHPFYEPGNEILSRFHNDIDLARVSYLMGGGIWNTDFGKDQDLFKDLEVEPGYVNLVDKLIPATIYEVNKYIADAISWNWYPRDIKTLIRPVDENRQIKTITLADDNIWTTVDDRTFLSENLFLNNLGHFRNYFIINPLIKAGIVPKLDGFHKNHKWADDPELYRKKLTLGENFGKIRIRIRKPGKRSKRRSKKRSMRKARRKSRRRSRRKPKTN